MMRRMRALAGGTLAATAMVVATLAFAQPRSRGRPSKPKPAASASENPYETTTTTSSSAAAPAPAASSAATESAPVPAPGGEAPDGGKLSPLNPAANEFSDAGAAPPSLDYDRLLADIRALRARVAAVSDTLFHSRIAISLETSGDHARIASLSVSLDDGVVWTSPETFRAEDSTIVYDHAVAPGHHALTVDVERRDDRNDIFRSAQRSRFIVDVPADERLQVQVKIWDDSNMGADFVSDKEGKYELRIRARAKAQVLPR